MANTAASIARLMLLKSENPARAGFSPVATNPIWLLLFQGATEGEFAPAILADMHNFIRGCFSHSGGFDYIAAARTLVLFARSRFFDRAFSSLNLGDDDCLALGTGHCNLFTRFQSFDVRDRVK